MERNQLLSSITDPHSAMKPKNRARKKKPLEHEENPSKHKEGLKPWAKGLTLATFLFWIFLFGYGLIINTSPHRAKLTRLLAAPTDTTTAPPSETMAAADTTIMMIAGTQTEAPELPEEATAATLFFLGIVVFLFYTPTNLAMLCALAGLMGALGRQARLHPMEIPGSGSKKKDDLPFDRINPYLSGVIRGFFVYMVLISGSMIFFDNPFTNPNAENYARLAGMLSLLSFIMSYNPLIYGSVFRRIDNYVLRKFQEATPTAKPENKEDDRKEPSTETPSAEPPKAASSNAEAQDDIPRKTTDSSDDGMKRAA